MVFTGLDLVEYEEYSRGPEGRSEEPDATGIFFVLLMGIECQEGKGLADGGR